MIKKGILVILAFFFVGKFCHKQTDGFALTKVSHQLLDEADPPLFVEATYRYLAKGGQAYVFLSEDGKSVLKLFRSSRLNALEMASSLIPHPVIKKALLKERQKCEHTLKSYRLASNCLQQETGLIAVHLGQNTPVGGTIKLIDNLGISHIINPQKIPFVIQKKAILIKEALSQFLASDGVEGANEAMRCLFMMIKMRHQLGIEDHDPNLAKNFGFIGTTPIEIDGGRFEKSLAPSLDKLHGSKEDLQHWINAHHPEFSESFHLKYQEIFGDHL